MDLKEIKTLIDLMRKNDLSEFRLETEAFKLFLKKGTDYQPMISASPLPTVVSAAPAAAPAPVSPTSVEAKATEVSKGKEIVSPMVGTFYRAASPESPNYVEEGQEVTEDTVVCLIEAMKVMNEIKAEVRGIIAEILVENGKPVQFGQPLFRLK